MQNFNQKMQWISKSRKKQIASWIVPWFDFIFLCLPKTTAQQDKILIVRLDAIGDFVLWLDCAKELFDYYKNQGKTVTLLANQAWAAWAGELKLADEVWALNPQKFMKNPRYRALWLRHVRATGFSTVVQPSYSRDLLTGDAIVRVSCALSRIGSTGDTTNTGAFFKRQADSWYTYLIPAANEQMMELRRNAEFMRGLTLKEYTSAIPILVESRIINLNLIPPSPYVVLFPAASWSGRVWPASRLVEIGRRILATGRLVVIAGGPGDEIFGKPVISGLNGMAINLVGKTTLSQLGELIRNSDLLITNETSAVHIGAAVSAPVLCILGGGHYGRFVPYQTDRIKSGQRLPVTVSRQMECFKCNWQCVYPRAMDEPVKCIDDIGVEQVWHQALRLLNE